MLPFHERGTDSVVAASMDVSDDMFSLRWVVSITELWQTALKDTGKEE